MLAIKKSFSVAWSFLFHSMRIGKKLATKNPIYRKKIILTEMHTGAKKVLKSLGVETYIDGVPVNEKAPFLICANHTSYLDPVILAAHFPCQGVTSTEIRSQGILGSLIGWLECPLVSRKIGRQLKEELNSARQYLQNGFSLQFYPEATSTSGEILPFRSSFFQLAMDTGIPVLPISIRYVSIDGKPIDENNRDLIYYYGDATFFSHLNRLLKIQYIKIHLHCHPLLFPKKFDHRRGITEAAEKSIRSFLD